MRRGRAQVLRAVVIEVVAERHTGSNRKQRACEGSVGDGRINVQEAANSLSASQVLRTSKGATRQRRHAGWLARQPWFNDSQRTAYRTSKLQVCAHKHGIGESSVMEWLDVAGWCPLAEAHLLDAVPDGLELIGKVLATGVGTAQANERKRSVGVPAFG